MDQAQKQLRALNQVSWITRIQQSFDQAGIPLYFLKGPVLSYLLYDDPFKRHSSDLDIWIQTKNLRKGESILRSLGLEPIPKQDFRGTQLDMLPILGRDWAFRHPDGLLIEMHWKVMEVPMTALNHWFDNGFDVAFSQVAFFGSQVRVPELSVRYPFYLLLHGALHFWYRDPWLKDWVQAMQQFGDYKGVRSMCRSFGLQNLFLVASLLAERRKLCELDQWDCHLRDEANSNPQVVAWVEKITANNPGDPNMPKGPKLKWETFWLTGLYLGAKWKVLCSWVYRLVIPSYSDLSMVRLPYIWTYYLVRPGLLLWRSFRRCMLNGAT